jgi:ubiquinone/menaquinone biosynthesis C-methylase UbiE
MSGIGECWRHILRNSEPNATIIAMDFSSKMVRRATTNKRQFPTHQIDIRKEDILNNSIENETADYVISGFGLKTFDAEQLHQLAQTIERILKTGGPFSLIDISILKNIRLQFFLPFLHKTNRSDFREIVFGKCRNLQNARRLYGGFSKCSGSRRYF